MTTAAPSTPRPSPTAASPRKRTGRVVYVVSTVGVVWFIGGAVWVLMNAFSSIDGQFSLVFLGAALFGAVMFLPIILVSIGIPAIVAVVAGSLVRPRVRAVWARALVTAAAGMTAFLVPVVLTWRGTEWDQGLVPIYVGMAFGVGLILGLAAVLPWRGGFASRRYEVSEVA